MTTRDDITFRPTRTLSRVLLRVTLLLALSLGMVSGLLQIWTDLQQEKDAVQYSAEEFLASVAPSAASAAYNFYGQAAEQVVEGLFTQRAITGVTIINEGDVMIERSRVVDPTLPSIGNLSLADEVVLSQPLFTPAETGRNEVIGSISITVDRSVVPPAIVNRMFSYFLLATIKNFLLGVLLIAIVYGALARYIVNLAETTGTWTPADGKLSLPRPPKLLAETELELLAGRIRQLAETASGRIREAEESRLAAVESNTELSKKSESLSQAIQVRNTELQRANARLKQIAERDSLTGLHNRRSFDRLAGEAFASAIRDRMQVSILLIDVDFFKAYNDYYGHQAGDECLVRFAKVIGSGATDNIIVARYGGEEFVAMVVGDDVDAAERYAAAIHRALRDAYIEHQRSTLADRITVSIGGASLLADTAPPDCSLDQLISAADEALYEAKRNGRNRTEFSTPEIRERVSRKRREARELLDAIESRAFEPHFQPQFDARTGRLVGAEALVRWRQRDGTIVSPDAFLETATESGLVHLIDRIVLSGVAEFVERARSRGLVVPRISLNTPRENLSQQGYIDDVIELARNGDTSIALELLETAMFDVPDEALMWQIDAVREAGLEIEIDDFGTGRTSIVSLMSLRPSRLKITKELVMPMLDSAPYATIVKSIIQIGEALDIDVVAEGIESAAVSERLIELGCAMQQGYYFGHPMPADAFLDRFAPVAPARVFAAAG